MEGYHRDSLRELRRQREEIEAKEKQSGSVFITLLIILLFLGAGGFYLKTTDRLPKEWSFSDMKQTVLQWGEELTEVFESKETAEVQATVDGVLSGENEKN